MSEEMIRLLKEPSPQTSKVIWDAAHGVIDCIRRDCSSPPQQIVSIASSEEAELFMRKAAPGEPRSLSDVIDDAIQVLSYRARMDHPRFFGFIPSPASPLSLIGDLLISGFNAHAGSWMQSSGPTAIEQGMIAWLARRTGLPAEAGGLFVSGGSMANLTGLIVARDRMLAPEDRRRGVAYLSAQTHSSVAKGLGILGLLPNQIRKIGVDVNRQLDPRSLAHAITADRAAGLLPFVVVANCGTTNTGSIDPLHAIADIAARERLWVHVDGAYGATVALSNQHRSLVEGIGRADSLSWDAHKWLFQTYGCGMVLVRDRTHLVQSFANNAEYLQDAVTHVETPNFWDYGIELTRPARAMKLWFTLQVMGEKALGDAIDHGFMLAKALEAQLRTLPNWQVVSPAQLAIVTFRYSPAGWDAKNLDRLNSVISRRMVEGNVGGTLSTKLDGNVVLRACTINPNTSTNDIHSMVVAMDAMAREIAIPGPNHGE